MNNRIIPMNQKNRKFSKDKEINRGSGRLPSMFDTEAKPIKEDRVSEQENTHRTTKKDASNSELSKDKEDSFQEV